MSNEPQFFLPAELVARAIHCLADECHAQIDALLAQPRQGDPDTKAERAFWLSQYRAFTKAAYHWGRGVRPVAAINGWFVPSASQGGIVHAVGRVGGVWTCGPTCEAKTFHWHTALVLGIEKAIDMADQEDDGLDLEAPAAPADEPIRFSCGAPIPDEPDWLADEGFMLPGLAIAPRARAAERRAA